MGREFALRQAKDHIGILKEAAAMLKAENAELKDEIRRHEKVFQFSAERIAALKGENEALREFVELTQSKWEEFGCDDGIVTVKYPWAIQERMREIALLTAEEQE